MPKCIYDVVFDANAVETILNADRITSMRRLHEKVSAMNKDYHDLLGKSVTAEKRMKMPDGHLSMWEKYEKHRTVCR